MEIVNESQVQKDKFRVAANKLLNHCFLLKKKEDTRNDYMFVMQHQQMIKEYFDLLGYNVVVNDSFGFIALESQYGTGRLRFKKIESILLLIFRLLYLEKRKELSLIDDVIVVSEDVYQKYNMLNIQSKINLDKTTIREATRLFKKYNLISLIDRDVTASDARILIYPSILFAVSNDNLTSVYESITDKILTYSQGGESDDEETSED